jgi:lipid II:glycine glycyltransferase (peptidoglycan interpeptide bridge formation enzyme)
LYWATAREFGNVWWHVFLQHHIMQRWLQHGYGFFDHWWVAPLWYTHYLSWVSRFKERFGWTRVEYVWNFDVVRNRLLYKVLQFFKKH